MWAEIQWPTIARHVITGEARKTASRKVSSKPCIQKTHVAGNWSAKNWKPFGHTKLLPTIITITIFLKLWLSTFSALPKDPAMLVLADPNPNLNHVKSKIQFYENLAFGKEKYHFCILYILILNICVYMWPKNNISTTYIDLLKMRGFPFLSYILGWGRVRSLPNIYIAYYLL